MNKLTEQIRAKGYTLTEFLTLINKSLSTFRKYEHVENLKTNKELKRRFFIVNKINELESKI